MSGQQVSPTEIENALLAYPDKLVTDVAVAGVSGGRTSDEKVPRAWVVLSEEGRRRGGEAVVEVLNAWIQKNLSKFKWLRGGSNEFWFIRYIYLGPFLASCSLICCFSFAYVPGN